MDKGTKTRGQWLVELRRSHAAGKHGDRRTKRNRDRGAQRRNAIRDAS